MSKILKALLLTLFCSTTTHIKQVQALTETEALGYSALGGTTVGGLLGYAIYSEFSRHGNTEMPLSGTRSKR